LEADTPRGLAHLVFSNRLTGDNRHR